MSKSHDMSFYQELIYTVPSLGCIRYCDMISISSSSLWSSSSGFIFSGSNVLFWILSFLSSFFCLLIKKLLYKNYNKYLKLLTTQKLNFSLEAKKLVVFQFYRSTNKYHHQFLIINKKKISKKIFRLKFIVSNTKMSMTC